MSDWVHPTVTPMKLYGKGQTGTEISLDRRRDVKSKVLCLPVEAPKARALTTCPTVCMPPSAITGTPNLRAYSATLYTDVP